jgi:hypothetical protein
MNISRTILAIVLGIAAVNYVTSSKDKTVVASVEPAATARPAVAVPTAPPEPLRATNVASDRYTNAVDSAPESEKGKGKRKAISIYFKNCSAARAAGYSNMLEGEPGYAPHLDRDNDGIACETR